MPTTYIFVEWGRTFIYDAIKAWVSGWQDSFWITSMVFESRVKVKYLYSGRIACNSHFNKIDTLTKWKMVKNELVGVCNCSMFCFKLLYVHSSIAIIFMGKRELVALLNLSSWCLVMVEWLFLGVPRGCLRFVIMVFPNHTHYFCLDKHALDVREMPVTSIITCTNMTHTICILDE